MRSRLRAATVLCALSSAIGGCGSHASQTALPNAAAPSPPTLPPPATSPTPPPNNFGPANEILVGNPSAIAQAQYPLQIGRLFRRGEYAQCVQAIYANARLQTQVDVKNRYSDGSLKFAVISMVLPSSAAGVEETIRFESASCASGGGLNAQQMLDQFDFDTRVAISKNGVPTGQASARRMLSDASFTRWTDGPVVTSVVLENHTAKTYDLGIDGLKALRPIFHVQFWPALGQYKVRVVMEQSDTSKLQSSTYAVQISTGASAPQIRYSNPNVVHSYATRWTKEYWSKTAPPPLNIKHGVAYLASTHGIPNYDPSITYSGAAKAALLAKWNTALKDLYAPGLWQKAMPSTGGRPDIGLFPAWHIAALYDGDARLWALSLEQANLAGAWPMHFRIGQTRVFDEATGVAGLGRVATRDAYPTQFMQDGNFYLNSNIVQAQDKFVTAPGWTASANDWGGDHAHTPDPFTLPYLATGDRFYLDQLQFWASWGLFVSNPSSACWGSGRSPKDTVIHGQTRGVAWTLRNRARAAFLSPDQTPEKAYFQRATENALHAMQGEHLAIAGTHPVQQWWAANRCATSSPNAMRYWEYAPLTAGYTGGPAGMKYGTAPWMTGFMIAVLGHTAELGFPSDALLREQGRFITNIFAAPGVDPWHLADYFIAHTKQDNTLYQSWGDAVRGWNDWQPAPMDARLGDIEHGYVSIMQTATSYLTVDPSGTSAWAWFHANAYSKQKWQDNPKWAILPRSAP